MSKSMPGFILGIIGGILGIILGITMLAGGAMTAFIPTVGAIMGSLGIGLGIWYIVSGALVVWFSTWMRDSKKCKNGGIWTLVLSVIGSGGILGLAGGIFGIVQGSKK